MDTPRWYSRAPCYFDSGLCVLFNGLRYMAATQAPAGLPVRSPGLGPYLGIASVFATAAGDYKQ